MVTKIYLIRHGEAENNRYNLNNPEQKRIFGRSNHLNLTDQGIQQAKDLGRKLQKFKIYPDIVYSSPAQRALQTARYTLSAMGVELDIAPDERLQERDVGHWTGELIDKVFTKAQISIINELGKNFSAPNGESFADIEKRMHRWAISVPESQTVFAFSHNNAIKCLISKIEGWDYPTTLNYEIENASANIFTLDHETRKLRYLQPFDQ